MTSNAPTERPFFIVSESSPPRKQRRPGPAHPAYGIPPEQWPEVLHRVEHGESLRQVAKSYRVSYETIRRILRALRTQQGGEE